MFTVVVNSPNAGYLLNVECVIYTVVFVFCSVLH